MSSRPSAVQEYVGYRRAQALPGIQIIDAENSAREWRVSCTAFAIVVFHTWRGSARLGPRTYTGGPGLAFCNGPGEVMVARPDGGRAGSFNVIELAPEVLVNWLADRGVRCSRPEWAEVMKPLSQELYGKFRRYFDNFDVLESSLYLQSETVELSECIMGGFLGRVGERRSSEGPAIRGTARMRECLTAGGFEVDLETLAKEVGLSRFQALRAFKRRYGLPPHAYQLCVRLGKARSLLTEGAAPVDVAMSCGFVDQSHFNRHFKRTFGVTPAQYAGRQSRCRSGVYRTGQVLDDPLSEITSRSDHRRR